MKHRLLSFILIALLSSVAAAQEEPLPIAPTPEAQPSVVKVADVKTSDALAPSVAATAP